jgi:hypothetical protein
MPLTGACAHGGFAVWVRLNPKTLNGGFAVWVAQLGRTAAHCHAAAAYQDASEMLSWLVLKVPGTVNSDQGPVKLDLLARDAFGRT